MFNALVKSIFFSPPSLETSNTFFLRPINTTKQNEKLYLLVKKEKSRLKKTLSWVSSIKSIKDIDRFLEQTKMLLHDLKSIRYYICKRSYNNDMNFEILGVLSIEMINTENPKLGYWIAKKWEGKGIVTAAVKSLIDEIFSTTPINTLYIFTGADNFRSKKIATQLNFKYLKKIEKFKFINDAWVDFDLYKLTKNEFESFSFSLPNLS